MQRPVGVLLVALSVVIGGCGDDADTEFGTHAADVAEGVCQSLTSEELARGLDVAPSEIKARVAERAVGAALLTFETEFLTGEVETPSESQLRDAERVARIGCSFGAQDLRRAIREADN